MVDKLLVAYNFPPFNDGSAVTMAKRLVEWGEPVDVISKDMGAHRVTDASILDLVAPLVRRHRQLQGPSTFAGWHSVRNFVEQGLAVLDEWGTTYEHVYSRSMFAHSHFLAAMAKRKHHAGAWTAEFSDPLTHGADGRLRVSQPVPDDPLAQRFLRVLPSWAEELLVRHPGVLPLAQMLAYAYADELVFTNDQQRAVMTEELPAAVARNIIQRSRIEAHPTLPARYYGAGSPIGDAQFRIGYFGNFYPNRGAGEFLEAWATCPREVRTAIQLEVFSDSSCEELRRGAVRLGIGDQVKIRDPLPLLGFLAASSGFDALLVTDIATHPFSVASPFLPSKVADYRGSSAPLMAIVQPGSPLDSLQGEFRSEFGDPVSIREMLIRAVREKRDRLQQPFVAKCERTS